jgi:hypothetical protein
VIHQTIKRRIEALEAREAPPVVYIWRECGESEAEAMKREGVKPGQNVVVFSWQDAALV